MGKFWLKRRRFLSLGFGAATASAGAWGSSRNGPDIHTSRIQEKFATDVVVAGGGPAGMGAALGASRAGAKTLLVENHGFPGGVGVWGLGMTINQMRPANRPRGDVHELIISKLRNYGDSAFWFQEHALICNVEYLKVALLDALDEAGCKYLLHTRAVDAVVENDRVSGLVIATKQGLVNVQAKVVVDCTGDADVAYYSDAETMIDEDVLSPMTLLLNFTNIPIEKEKLSAFRAEIKKFRAEAVKKYPLLPQSWGMATLPISTLARTNHSGTKTLGIFDGTDPEQLTQAEALSRRQAIQMTEAMREFGGPELRNIQLANTGPNIGVRETRRVKGVYVLTEDDAKTGRKFDDVIAWRSGHLDIGFVRLERMKIHDVPYRAILPVKVDGLLMAGRSISATHVAASAGKSMGNCVATGHAAGLAAAICARKNIVPREIDVKELQDALRADHVDLDRGGEVQDWLT